MAIRSAEFNIPCAIGCGEQQFERLREYKNITIDGQNSIVEISGVTGYPGLVQNGDSSTNGKNNIIIKNLGVTATNGSTLGDSAGWVGQRYMNKGVGTTCHVTNCNSTGDISPIESGGIFGANSQGTATNCYIANGNWIDTAAGETNRLLGVPTYLGSILTSQGSIWFDVDPVNSNVPFRLKSFNPTIIQMI